MTNTHRAGEKGVVLLGKVQVSEGILGMSSGGQGHAVSSFHINGELGSLHGHQMNPASSQHQLF